MRASLVRRRLPRLCPPRAPVLHRTPPSRCRTLRAAPVSSAARSIPRPGPDDDGSRATKPVAWRRSCLVSLEVGSLPTPPSRGTHATMHISSRTSSSRPNPTNPPPPPCVRRRCGPECAPCRSHARLDLGEGGAGAVWGPASPGYCFPAISYARRTLAGTSRALISRTVPPALTGALSKFSQMWARDCSVPSSKSRRNVVTFFG